MPIYEPIMIIEANKVTYLFAFSLLMYSRFYSSSLILFGLFSGLLKGDELPEEASLIAR